MLPQEGLPLLAPSQLSQLVVNRAKRTGERLQGVDAMLLSTHRAFNPLRLPHRLARADV